jgi:negative regulator of flagellin synthesis FlgM
MSIDRLSANSAARTYVQNAEVAGANSAAKAKSAEQGANKASRADSVTLSADARSLAAARDAVQQAPDVRAEKVDAIKQSVADGTYSVPASVLARKLLDASNQS